MHFRSFGLALGLSCAAVACGGTTETPNDQTASDAADETSGGDATVDGATDTSSEAAADATDAAVDAPSDGPIVCTSLSTKSACVACCDEQHTAGRDTFRAALLGCGCGDGVCKTECATTACATPAKKADAACSTCLDDTLKMAPKGDAGTDAGDAGEPWGACISPVTSACTASADCKAYLACINECGKKL